MTAERGPRGLAESQRLQSTGQGRGVDRPKQTRDRRYPPLAHRPDRGDRGRHRWRSAEQMLKFGRPNYVRIACPSIVHIRATRPLQTLAAEKHPYAVRSIPRNDNQTWIPAAISG